MPILTVLVCVALLNLYAIVLIVLRARVYGVALYRPMIVNVGLSFLPVLGAILAIAGLLVASGLLNRLDLSPWAATTGLWVYLVAGVAMWLLFFPNSIYLITELNFSHRRDDDPIPLWFDIVQTLTLTLSGIANAVVSLAMVQTVFAVVIVDADSGIPASSWVFAGVIVVLGAVGVYLGRYLRFNSWDVRHPASMVRKLAAHLRLRGKALEAGGFVVTHAVLIGLVYVPLYTVGFPAIGV